MSRLRSLAPIRDYVGQAYPPSADDLMLASGFYLNLASELGPKIGKDGGAEAVRHIGAEYANIESLILERLKAGWFVDAVSVAYGIAEFIRFTGQAGPQVIVRLAEAAHAAGEVLGEADCIKGLGDIALARSDHEGARVRFEAALVLYRQIGDVLGEANCIVSLGEIAFARCEYEAAGVSSNEALDLFTGRWRMFSAKRTASSNT